MPWDSYPKAIFAKITLLGDDFMDYFSISQERLCPDFDIDPAEKGKIDSFLRFLDTTGL